MNRILKLSGSFSYKSNAASPGAPELPHGKTVDSTKVRRLVEELKDVLAFWEKQTLGFKPLVSIHYIDVIAKSNRVGSVFSSRGTSSNQTIVGARFTDDQRPRHVITHCITMDCIRDSIANLEYCLEIISDEFNGSISHEKLKMLTSNKITLKSTELSKSTFARLVKDSFYVDRFDIPTYEGRPEIKTSHIVTLYDTGASFEEILRSVDLSNRVFDRLDDHTWLLNPNQFADLYRKAPYLISMSLTDLKEMDPIQYTSSVSENSGIGCMTIPKPTNEPVIGVIDTLFSKEVYFSDWVEYHEILDPVLIDGDDDYVHGTEVTSLIVDGPSLNPHLQDGCGRFRVRHFGVAKHGKNSSVTLIKNIRDIVLANKDIKVWNISLGSEMETSFNSISPEAAMLDRIQYENDVIFVIAGTNNNDRRIDAPRVGSPADSINSIVVNSVLYSGSPAPYSRRGPVLCFFNKPDVCAYGGDDLDPITVCEKRGLRKNTGTSFAAPWITRKLAYLIHILKFSREVAKALIIDASCGWDTDTRMQPLLGFGRVPTHINDIIKTQDDEIKFTMQSTVESYETYAYTIPVPLHKEKFPFIAKATLCYFPKCSRNQGVDYTDTELDIHFGRMDSNGKIKSIDNNMQGDSEFVLLYEANARREYRKWDNVKHISEGTKDNARAKKTYTKKITPEQTQVFDTWGLSIKKKERLEGDAGKGLHFGVVITLKEIEGKNRIQEFIQRCKAGYWFTEEVDVQTMIENYLAEDAEIEFDE